MPAILLSILRIFVAQFIVRAFVGAGLSLVTYYGISGYVEGFLTNWVAAMEGLPSDLAQLFLIAGVGTAIDIIGSAILSVVAIKLAMRTFGVGAAT